MSDKPPRQTKARARIRKAVLQLESFTVEELCLRTGLKREYVYHELAQLKKDGYLDSETFHESDPDRVRPSRRPKNIYRLTQDPAKKYRLSESVPSSLAWESNLFGRAAPQIRQNDLVKPDLLKFLAWESMHWLHAT